MDNYFKIFISHVLIGIKLYYQYKIYKFKVLKVYKKNIRDYID